MIKNYITLSTKSIGFIWIIFDNPKIILMTKQNNLILLSAKHNNPDPNSL